MCLPDGFVYLSCMFTNYFPTWKHKDSGVAPEYFCECFGSFNTQVDAVIFNRGALGARTPLDHF